MANTEKDVEAIRLARERGNVPSGDNYERMISGMRYEAYTPELIEGRFRARRLMQKFNNHFPEDATAESLSRDRSAMLTEMLGKVGPGAEIEPPLRFDYGCNIVLGEKFYANFGLVILDCAPVTIGHRVMCGPSVSIYAATHETGVQSRRDLIEFAKPVTIGDDCWIGGNTTILPGVNIGKGCTIGAGSVVTEDIPPWSVAVGSPAKVIKKVEPVPDL